MKGKPHSGDTGSVVNSALAYPGNSFKYSPRLPPEEPLQNLFLMDTPATTQQSEAASITLSVCPSRLVNGSVVFSNTDKSKDVSNAGSLQRRRKSSQKSDDVCPTAEEGTKESAGLNKRHLHTKTVIVQVLQNTPDVEHSCTD